MKVERLCLQSAVAAFSLIPILAGINGILGGPNFLDTIGSPAMDSHFRYLSGLLLAIGLAFVSAIPKIQNQGARIRLLTIIVFLGGLGRLFGVIVAGTPPPPMLGGLVMELGVTPALAAWQWRVSRSH